MKRTLITLSIGLAVVPQLALASGSQSAAPNRAASATKARDINGVALAMPIADVRKLMQLSPVGGGQFEGDRDGIHFTIEFTPLGRAFNIMASQPLGSFEVDRSFVLALTDKLITKYGPASEASGDNFHWSCIEEVQTPQGQRRNFETNWATAYVGGGPGSGEKTLELQMIDFRIMWADSAKLNSGPRQAGADSIKF